MARVFDHGEQMPEPINPVPAVRGRHPLLRRKAGDVAVQGREMLLDREEASMRPPLPAGATPAFPACDDRAVPMVWTRFCPVCSARLEKRQATDPWVCRCGWRSPGGICHANPSRKPLARFWV